MKNLKTLAITAIAALAFTSCKTNQKTADKAALQVEGITDDVIVYEVMDYDYPLADTVAKYSMKGMAGDQLTRNMKNYSKMLTPNLKDKATVVQFGEGIVVALDRGDIYEVAETKLTDNGKSILRHLAYNLEKMPDTYILVAGRTDATGTDEFNEKLAYRRAAYAANYLKGCGISEDRFFIDSFGEKFPDFSNSSSFLRDRNRRVDFLLIPSNEMRENVAIP